MAGSDLLNLVQAKLSSGENVISINQARLMQGWVGFSRILALVEREGNHALFILLSARMPPDTFTDLSIERVIAIDSDFRCDVDDASKHQDGNDIFVNVTSKKIKLLFEMVPGSKTSDFVSNLFRASDQVGKKRGGFPEFHWLTKYNSGSAQPHDEKEEIGSDSLLLDSPELAVPRQSIAKGATPIAARESVIRYQMAMKEDDYTLSEVIRVFVGTWNVNGQAPCASLADWLASDVEPPDIYAIGFQELDLSKEAFLFNDTPREDEWRFAVTNSLHPKAKYRRIALVRLVGMMLLVFVREQYAPFVQSVATETVGTGIMGKLAYSRLFLTLSIKVRRGYAEDGTQCLGTVIRNQLTNGNKGGVGVRLDMHRTSICFVNSHLAAHVEEYERRNQDFHDICSRATFTFHSTPPTPPRSIKDHDQVYWLGDLNYRITDMDPRLVKDLVDAENYKPILECDQLKIQHRMKNIFVGFKEGEINFRPTYKYDTGTDNWDSRKKELIEKKKKTKEEIERKKIKSVESRPSVVQKHCSSHEKNRAPAWCDRILWKGDQIKQQHYRSHPQLCVSDHKPVSAVFLSEIRVVDEVKYRKIHEEVMKKLDKLENEFLPQVMVDNTEIIFDVLRFLESQSKDLIIANTGQVPVQFEFIKKLDDTSYCKDWLHIEPYTGFIKPGEKCDIKLEVYVDKKSACKLNSGQDKLYDILVLHLEGGKDIFITVTGTYERSCFGSSIETLVHVTIPIREVPIGKLMELENSKDTPQSQPYAIPKEIWFLVDHLYRYGLKQQHLFEHPGLHSELILIRNWLDNGSSDPLPGSVHSVAEALLLLLESTAEPIIPYNLHNVCLGASSNYLQCKQIVMQLSEHTKNVFLYLSAFLQELLSHSADNELDAKTIATLFGAIFLRDPPRSRSDMATRSRTNQTTLDRKKANFVYHFLVNDQSELIGCS